MAQTPNYGLHLTDDSSEKFLDWRNAMNGTGQSNMGIIDTVLGDLDDAVESMQSEKGAAGGVATLGSGGTIPTEQLAPSGNVGDVLTRLSGGTAWLPGGGGGGSGNIVAKSYLVTLTASGWSGSGPYTQTVTVSGAITATTAGLIGAAQSATAQQRAAARAAVLGISGQGTDTVTVIADGVKPVVDIPAEIVIFAGSSDYYTKSVTDALIAGSVTSTVSTITFDTIDANGWSYKYIPSTPIYTNFKSRIISITCITSDSSCIAGVFLHTNGYLYVTCHNLYSQAISNVTVDVIVTLRP